MPIRTAIVEDVAGFAKALARSITAEGSDIVCTGVYPTAEAALEAFRDNAPEVVIVDINLPGMSGIELVARLKESSPTVLPLILTTYEDPVLIFDALKAGACGYLLKRSTAEEIASAIVQVHSGGSPMSPQIARQVVTFFHQQPGGDGLAVLSEREKEVLQLLADGAMYKEIAHQLSISMDTVRSHVRKIYEKLHVRSRTEAVLKYFGKRR